MFGKTRSSWTGRLTLSCIVLLSGLSLGSAARAQSVDQAQTDVGAAVAEAVDATGRARVLITLRAPVAATGAAPEREAAIAAAQDAVLAQLPPNELTLLRRYRSVPGLAAFITENVLKILRADPRVSSIELDEAGGAHPDHVPRAR